MTLPFEEFVREDQKIFLDKVLQVARYLIVKPEWLMFTMWFESRLDHRIVNYQKGDPADPDVRCLKRATGLIQFMPSTSILLGTNNQKLRQMKNYEQMEYVSRHLGIFKGRYKSWLDLYCAIFWPAAVGKKMTYRITSDIVAKQNPVFDQNKDLDIEKMEIYKALRNQIPDKYKALYV